MPMVYQLQAQRRKVDVPAKERDGGGRPVSYQGSGLQRFHAPKMLHYMRAQMLLRGKGEASLRGGRMQGMGAPQSFDMGRAKAFLQEMSL